MGIAGVSGRLVIMGPLDLWKNRLLCQNDRYLGLGENVKSLDLAARLLPLMQEDANSGSTKKQLSMYLVSPVVFSISLILACLLVFSPCP